MADPQRLRQVLLNLCSNAIKYNRQGGLVRVSAQAQADGQVSLTVQDSGIGMTSEQMSRLFQPFDRLGAERTKVPGTGLGLVICLGLVNEMGGSLQVQSDPHAGTTATVTLRAAG
jgi:signal transduction histidine kinase